MTMAYPVELLQDAASVEDCGHLVEKRVTDNGGRERCLECERDRKRDYEARREPRVRRRDAEPSAVVSQTELRSQVRLHVVEEPLPARPSCRAECADVPRPCPFVSCRFSLYLDVSSRGALRLNFPALEPGEMPAESSCALDVAERGGRLEDEVAAALNINRRWVQKIEARAFRKLQHRAAGLLDHLE